MHHSYETLTFQKYQSSIDIKDSKKIAIASCACSSTSQDSEDFLFPLGHLTVPFQVTFVALF